LYVWILDIGFYLKFVFCILYFFTHPLSRIAHQNPASGIRYPASGIRYPASGIRDLFSK